MPKIKTNRAAAKRIKKRAKSFKRKKANLRHILTKKTTKRKRNLRQKTELDKTNTKEAKRLLPNL